MSKTKHVRIRSIRIVMAGLTAVGLTAGGFGQSAYFREPSYFDTAGVKQWPDVHTQRGPYDPACYTTLGLQKGGPNFERVLYCGGPGGDSPGYN